MGIATAALDQPGDEGCAYGRAKQDWQRWTEGRFFRRGSVASGTGTLGGRSGAGRWNTRLSGGNCSASWQANGADHQKRPGRSPGPFL